MNNTFCFLRHAETKVDRNTPVSKWVLSEKGEKQAQKLAADSIFDDIDLIFSSTETKASQTAKPVANKLGKQVNQLKEITELDRDRGVFMDQGEYEKTIKQCLENPDESFNNWETAAHALGRFERKVEELDRQYKKNPSCRTWFYYQFVFCTITWATGQNSREAWSERFCRLGQSRK